MNQADSYNNTGDKGNPLKTCNHDVVTPLSVAIASKKNSPRISCCILTKECDRLVSAKQCCALSIPEGISWSGLYISIHSQSLMEAARAP
ncbi:MAG: hypothetical protein KME32_26060 [Mojavia pulchra JT2-VF2]|jgi:hypothetical protein|uniref:Uncharacterized protein n=1 Tax=Mojavia pulchra JT2-VF2 TaxID=287848 RepID=A0A951Q2G8_9NOST|nr:hypothetical protein [Mojavia pulchra JT2-VF2]